MAQRRKQNEHGHQALKAKATREKILNAVVELINEGGYSAASSTAIAKRAKITWGAVQHHYGNKDEILMAVLEMSRDAYIDSLQSSELQSGTLEQRVSLFIDKMWQHYKSDLYFAFSEIIMATRGKNNALSLRSLRFNKQLDAHMNSALNIFQGHQSSKDALNDAMRYVNRFLAGFAMDHILDPTMPYEAIHIQRIKDQFIDLINDQPQ